MIDARARVENLHNEALGVRLVDEFEFAPLDDQQLAGPRALPKECLSGRVAATNGKATKRLDVAPGQPLEVLLRHRRAQPRGESRAVGPRLP